MSDPKKMLGVGAACAVVLAGTAPAADLCRFGHFDPANAAGLCSVAFDHTTGHVWVYDCSASDVQGYSSAGDFVVAVPRPGESANDVDLDFAPETLTLGTSSIPAGTLLFINGETDAAEIYAVDKDTGEVLETLATAFGVSHVVGGAYHAARDTFFLVQDRVPGGQQANLVGEIDPVSGAVLNSFRIDDAFDVNFGDLEVSVATGHLLVVSSVESRVAEFTPAGVFVQYHALPEDVGSLSGIGLDDATGEMWVGSTDGDVWLVGPPRCRPDLDCSGAVDFGDILAVLRAWGNAGGPEDLDDSGRVDFADILIILREWGPCP